MNKSKIHMFICSFLISILTIFVQLEGIYYLDSNHIILMTLSSITILLLSHVLLWLYKNYNACFIYLFLIVTEQIILFSLLNYDIITIPITLHTYHILILGFCNLLIPLYCTLRAIIDRSSKIIHYKQFFIQSSILFALFYIGILYYRLFYHTTDLVLRISQAPLYQLVPLSSIASHIEDYIKNQKSLHEFLKYCLKYMLLFIPLGFYTKLIFRNKYSLLRLFTCILIPSIMEYLQYRMSIGYCNIDDIILAFIGCAIGTICFNLINHIFITFTEHEFLKEPISFQYFSYRNYTNDHYY